MTKACGVLLMACVGLVGCAPFFTPVTAPTLDPGTLNSIVVQTANAAGTQTARVGTPNPIPTSTLLITTTPSEIASITPTFIFVLKTPTKPAPTTTISEDDSGYACEILDQMPTDDTVFAPDVNFETRWQVRNSGSRVWDSNSMDYRFVSGDVMHKQPIYDLYKDVRLGDLADIIVKMKSPANPGTFSTTWRLRIGNKSFCTMKLTIIVR